MRHEDGSQVGAATAEKGKGPVLLASDEAGHHGHRRIFQNAQHAGNVDATRLGVQDRAAGPQAKPDFIYNHGMSDRTKPATTATDAFSKTLNTRGTSMPQGSAFKTGPRVRRPSRTSSTTTECQIGRSRPPRPPTHFPKRSTRGERRCHKARRSRPGRGSAGQAGLHLQPRNV